MHEIYNALHETLLRHYRRLGEGCGRATYALNTRLVIKAPHGPQDADQNQAEYALWRLHKDKKCNPLTPCRLVDILGVPCLIMQYVEPDGLGVRKYNSFPHKNSPGFDGHQGGKLRSGRYAYYDYAFFSSWKNCKCNDCKLSPLRKYFHEKYPQLADRTGHLGQVA